MSAVGLDLSLSATGVALASGELRTIKSTVDDGTVAGRAHRIADLADRITSCVPVVGRALDDGQGTDGDAGGDPVGQVG